MKLNHLPLAVTAIILIAAAILPLNIIPVIVLSALAGGYFVITERQSGLVQGLESRLVSAEAQAEMSLHKLVESSQELAKLKGEVDSISKKLAFK